MQQIVYECLMNSVDDLKLRLIDVWSCLQQNVIDAAVNEWRKQQYWEHACMQIDNIWTLVASACN